MSRTRLAVATALLVLPAGLLPASAAAPGASERGRPDPDVRFQTYNASLNRAAEGQLVSDLSTPGNAQARQVAEIIQRTRPDVLLINEFDYDEEGLAADLFRSNYLEVSQRGAEPIDYPYAYVAPVNTGVPSGQDLDNSGTVGGPGDAFGFGFFPGQYGMVVYSRYPIDTDAVRTFQGFLWKDMPGALLPDDPATPAPADYYSAAELDVFRLSSKSHWDVPVEIGRRTVHFLVSHPTPPVFDGPEDRNGTRNHDEIRFWSDYVRGGRRAAYIYDDEGRGGGLRGGAFVIAGDQNSDPLDGDSIPGSAQLLLDNPRVNDRRTPSSQGAVEAAAAQPGNETHRSPARFDTADFSEPPGNLRADYVLPSRSLRILDSGVFWPRTTEPYADLVSASDHRPVWVDVKLRHHR
ncbi:endonuclease/exonuclease/phosphatase family protein [Nocardioides euryhalodurans]|uniref:Endonuclease/exonuclease/phosphatase family protein n=1 Tax=Nocardioides euryhalodurans TaxID=2518370 RepID=A0A4P7GJG9_9ACTN|nr:endonuclease/exonuclease/phosphatase family protein [Nocardioides euryhalodurans]QBR91781.1 endonuclease/exonuclease/phosphatase family protein [Nocardioides euryhalodurans]